MWWRPGCLRDRSQRSEVLTGPIRIALDKLADRFNTWEPRPLPMDVLRLERDVRELRPSCRTSKERVAVDGMLGLVMLTSHEVNGDPGHLDESIMLLSRLVRSSFTGLHQMVFAEALGRALDRRWRTDRTAADLRQRIELWRLVVAETGDRWSSMRLVTALQDRYFATDDVVLLDEIVELRRHLGAAEPGYAELTEKFAALRERRRGGSAQPPEAGSEESTIEVCPAVLRAASRSAAPLQSGAVLAAVIETSPAAEWERLMLEAPLLSSPGLTTLVDDAKGGYRWRGLTVSGPLARTLEIASVVADTYGLDSFAPGTLALSVFLNETCGVTAAVSASGGSPAHLARLVQEDLLGTELDDVVSVIRRVVTFSQERVDG